MRKEVQNIDKIATANRIRDIRLRTGYKQYELAEKLGVSPEVLSKWECAYVLPTLDNLVAFADVAGCSLDDCVIRKRREE